MDAMAISNRGLLPGLEEVGRRFADHRIFLPQVMQSAETMQSAFAHLKKIMAGQTGPSRGRILMATVEGDIHDIAKDIVVFMEGEITDSLNGELMLEVLQGRVSTEGGIRRIEEISPETVKPVLDYWAKEHAELVFEAQTGKI